MNNTLDKLFLILILIFPTLLITGPAIPDIILTIFVIYYLIKLFHTNHIFNIKIYWFYFGIIFCIGAVISSILAYDYKVHSISSSLPYVRFILFCYLFNYFILKSPKNFFIIINIIGITIFFVSIDICIQYYFGKDVFGFESDVVRNSGPFGDELKGGSYISKLFIPVFSIFYFFSLVNKKYQLILPFFFIVCFFGLLYSGERSALIIFIFSNFIFFTLLFIKNLKIYITSIFIFLFAFIISINYFLSDDLKQRYLITTLNDIKSIQNVIDSHYGAHYVTALSIFKDYPLIGIGQNNFRNKCSDEKYSNLNSKRINDRCSTHPHSYYLQILSDLGIVNFFIFIILILSFFYQVYSNRMQTEKIIYYGKIISLLVIFWPLLPTGSFYNNWNSCLNWLIISLSIFNMNKTYSKELLYFLKNKNEKI